MAINIIREPVYQQLNTALRELIMSEEFKVGEKFLTERQICARYDVSRATANKALSNLVTGGILEFKKGVGTFVRRLILDYDLRVLVSFESKVRQAGKTPSTIVFTMETMTARSAGKEITERLKLSPDDELYFIKRLRLADDLPVILERRYLTRLYCPDLREEELKGSLYNLLVRKYNLRITGGAEVIRAIIIPSEDAALLRCRQGQAGLLVLETGFIDQGVPIWFTEILYRGDSYELRNSLGTAQTLNQASSGVIVDYSKEET